jgi:predicted secreted protein
MPVPIGMGTILAVSTSTGQLGIAGIRDIGGPEADTTPIDITAMDSAGNFREFLGGGPIDGGEVPLDLVFSTTHRTQKMLISDLYAGTQRNYTVTFHTTASETMTFAAFVTHIGQSIPYEGHVSRAVTLKVTKNPGFTTS